jgi:hypothetical protein
LVAIAVIFSFHTRQPVAQTPDSEVNYRPLIGRLGFFPTVSGRKTKARQCYKVAVETGCRAPGLKQPI